MKKSELIEILCSSDEEEVFIKRGDGLLDDIEIEYVEEQFDGFDEFFPPCIALVHKEKEID